MNLKKIDKLLASIKKFGVTLSDTDISRIFKKTVIAKYHRGEWLLKRRQVCDYVYFLNSGMVKTSVSVDEYDATTWVTLGGNFFTSLESFRTGSPSLIAFQCISTSEVLSIHRDSLAELNEQIPALRELALNILSDYYSELEKLYIFCLSLPAAKRYAKFHEYFPDHFCNVPLKYLASMIHVKPETLSRIKKVHSSDGNLGLRQTG